MKEFDLYGELAIIEHSNDFDHKEDASKNIENHLSKVKDELETVNAAYQDLSKENSTLKAENERLKRDARNRL